jgi:hypothetical protein
MSVYNVKAYDCIDRRLLWRAIGSMGVHGQFMHVLQNMHQNISMSVRMAGQLGNTFPAELGVKQGDPLSPLLFGLFIDRIENYMRQCCPNQGVSRDGLSILQLLLYADDLVLLAES